jgi:hypothetical protein
MLTWSGKSNVSSDENQKEPVNTIHKLENTLFDYQNPKKIYFKENCVICLTENGMVYKNGNFNFERKNEKKSNEWVKISRNTKEIVKIKFGSYHILLLNKDGQIFSLGDNYYGQLGIDNMIVAMSKKPIEVKYRNSSLIGKKIHAYKYNSFAIDKNDRLFIWGKKDYLMGIYKMNLFNPTIFIPDYKVDDIKHSEGRIIIHAYKVIKSKDESYYNKDEEEEIDNFSILTEENNLKESMIVDKKSIEKSIKSNKIEGNDETQFVRISKEEKEKRRKRYKTISQFMEDFSNELEKEKIFIDKIRKYVLSDEELFLVKKVNINNMWDDLWSNLEKISNRIEYSKGLELFASFFTVNIHAFLEKINYKGYLDLGKEEIKKSEDLLKRFQYYNTSKEKLILSNIFNVLNNTMIYKSIQFFVYQLATFQYLVKSINFKDLLNNLNDVFNQSSEIQTKSCLVERICQNIICMNSLFEDVLKKIRRYISFSSLKLPETQIYIFKYLLESNEDIKDYWLFYTYYSKEEYILKIKKEKMYDIHKFFIDTFNKYNTLFNKHKKCNLFPENSENEEQKNIVEFSEDIKSYDEYIIEIKKEIKKILNERNEIMKKEMVVDFLISIIQMFETKKLLILLLLKTNQDLNI